MTLEQTPRRTTGERLYPADITATDDPQLRSHLSRYQFAASRVPTGADVLDASCGSGYGSSLLAKQAARVVGIDISDDALSFARQHFAYQNVEYRMADLAARLPFADETFDAIVSLETIEHVHNQRFLLREFSRVLRPNGIIVASTPDRDILSAQAGYANPFHVAELSKADFVALLEYEFEVLETYGQGRFVPRTAIREVLHSLARLDRWNVRHVVKRFVAIDSWSMTPVEHATAHLVSPIPRTGQPSHFHIVVVAIKPASTRTG